MDIAVTITTRDNLIRKSYVSSKIIDAMYSVISATYHGDTCTGIDNPTDYNPKHLGDFLTYILHCPENVETPLVKVSDNRVCGNDLYCDDFVGRIFVCFSGGVDSAGALLNYIDSGEVPVALWCNYGQSYSKSERSAVERICRILNVPLIEATIDLMELIEIGGNKYGHIFPARNLLIASIALCFRPSKIVLAGLVDEVVVPDKSVRMYEEFGKIFGTELYSPFIGATKTEVLCVWRYKWDRYLSADETVSCYNPNGNCQNCSSCAKRETAMVASGYHNYFPTVFLNQSELIEQHWFSRIDSFMYERRADLLIALEKFAGQLPPAVQSLVENCCASYNLEIQRRKEHLNSLLRGNIPNGFFRV